MALENDELRMRLSQHGMLADQPEVSSATFDTQAQSPDQAPERWSNFLANTTRDRIQPDETHPSASESGIASSVDAPLALSSPAALDGLPIASIESCFKL